MPEPMSSHAVTINTPDAGELVFDVLRSGADADRQVIALHGFPQGARTWTRVAERLAGSGIGLVALDQRGYSPGARPEGTEHYRDDLLSADVLGVADALGLNVFHLAGHDWGAHIAWVTAARNPERVLSLTAVSIPHPSAFGRAFRDDPDQARRSDYFRLFWQPGVAERTLLADDASRLRETLGDVEDDDKEHYISRLAKPGALTAALSWYRAMSASSGATPPVTVPTTYVWSDQDDAVGRTAAEGCAEYVDADYRFVALEGVSHWIPERAPGPLADAIAARVASV